MSKGIERLQELGLRPVDHFSQSEFGELIRKLFIQEKQFRPVHQYIEENFLENSISTRASHWIRRNVLKYF
ncbi:hypothetical protein GF327_04050 [Candidatus Woesearchaeota archaeon]|nr:hypothetical protein [Candidatus Woesearchaeota archaeon]